MRGLYIWLEREKRKSPSLGSQRHHQLHDATTHRALPHKQDPDQPHTTHHATATFPKFFGKKIREFGVVENPSAQRVATRKLKSQKTQRTHKTHRLLPLSTFSSSSRRQTAEIPKHQNSDIPRPSQSSRPSSKELIKRRMLPAAAAVVV